ncbi:tetratricopeptide repeat protein [Polymorphobacter sp.]|uniref:tetratricopeptide repeat protein n=1 Tax=Polymorphobacter sp. TaxID=1909290 RepID=UPI003F713395
MASIATAATEKASIDAFKRDVIDASKTALVLVDFWAEWCGPCKTLGPLLEKVTAAHAPRVKLVKIDVDKNQTLAAQFRIQSIPTVYAFLGGAPVDGFQGALGERELNAFIERLLAGAPPAPGDTDDAAQIAELLDAARELSTAGGHDDALAMLAALGAELPEREDIAAAEAQALLAAGRAEEAGTVLARIPADSKDPEIARARAAVALALEASPVDDLAGLEAQVAAAPDDHALRFELASGYLARADRDQAADHLLAIVAADRGWNEGAARDRLLKLFEAAGLADPWSIKTRARLRAILFS